MRPLTIRALLATATEDMTRDLHPSQRLRGHRPLRSTVAAVPRFRRRPMSPDHRPGKRVRPDRHVLCPARGPTSHAGPCATRTTASSGSFQTTLQQTRSRTRRPLLFALSLDSAISEVRARKGAAARSTWQLITLSTTPSVALTKVFSTVLDDRRLQLNPSKCECIPAQSLPASDHLTEGTTSASR